VVVDGQTNSLMRNRKDGERSLGGGREDGEDDKTDKWKAGL
jgi:hypothetical protein